MRVYELAKPLRDTEQRLDAMTDRMGEIEELLASADLDDTTKEGLSEDAQAISDEIEEVKEALERANHLGRGTSGISNWSGRPSADQLWAIESTWEEIPAVIDRVNALLTTRLPGLEDRLRDAGVHASLGEPITVPRRP
jgi:chromosome segregation ATPase